MKKQNSKRVSSVKSFSGKKKTSSSSRVVTGGKSKSLNLFWAIALVVVGVFVISKGFKKMADVLGSVTVNPGYSIQSAISAASLDDVITVKVGNYSDQTVTVNKKLTLRCETKHGCIVKNIIVSGSGATVDGFYSLNSSAQAGGVFVSGNDNIVKNIKIESACMTGIRMDGSRNLAEGNEILKSKQCTGQSGADADGIRMFADGNRARGNYIHDIPRAGNATAHIDCFQSWGTLTNAVIENNICDLPESDSGLQTDTGDNAKNITLRGNVFISKRGLNVWGDNIKFINNVYVGGFDPSSYVSFRSGTTNATFQNNIIYNTSTGIIAPPSSSGPAVTLGGYNIFFNSSGIKPTRDSDYNGGSSSLKWPTDKWQTVNPQLINTTNPTAPDYFRVSSSSPACTGGVGGTYIGAFPCGTSSDPISTPAPTTVVTPTSTPAVVVTSTPAPTTVITPTTATSTPTPTTVVVTPTPITEKVAPVITISTPLDKSTLPTGYRFDIKTKASDPSGTSKIKVYFNSTLRKTCYSASTCNTTKMLWNIGKGTHTITVKAWDVFDNRSTKTITVYKD